MNNPAIWLLAVLAAPCALLAMRYWQRALFVVFVLMVFEGALRKWVLPSAQAQIYLVKDAILLAAYVGFLFDSRVKSLPPLKGVGLIKTILIVGFVFGCFEVLNPNSPSVLIGLAGLKSYFLYPPVAFILPYAINSREHLFGLIRRYLIVAIPVAVLGFLQIMAGPASPLNMYVSWTEDAPALLSYFGSTVEFVRTSGTFSYISGYTAFLSFIALLAIGYNMAHGWQLKNNIMPLLALTLVAGAMFTTGSRAPIYTLLGTGPIILWLAARSRVLSVQTAMRLLILIPILAIVAVNLSPQAFQAFMERSNEADSSYTLLRLFSPFYQTVAALSDGPAIGLGIGTTLPSSVAIMGADFPSWVPDKLLVEDEMARVTVELGLLGLLLVYFLRFLVAAFAWRWTMSFRDPAYRALGISLTVYLGLALISNPIILSVTAGLYHWGALGLVLTMRRLEQLAGTKFGKVLLRGTSQRTNLQPVMPMAGAAPRRPS